jgi:hypothetical protein
MLKELEFSSPTALERRYLRLKIDTLTNAITRLSVTDITFEDHSRGTSRLSWGTHYSQIDDPGEQTEDITMETMRILLALRRCKPSTPATQIAAEVENLAIGLLDLGLYEDARQTYMQVVRIYRCSIAEESRPVIIDARVARALIGVSTSFQRLGMLQEGLEAIQEAESIFSRLETAHPSCFQHEWALTLNNLANHMRDACHYHPAMTAANKAVELRRQLTNECPEAHKADLSASLLTASTCYSKLAGMEHLALLTVQEAVSLSRELVDRQPDVFEPYLGAALLNCANRRAALYDNVNAYRDIQEAVEIRRKLSTLRPEVFSAGFSRSLFVAERLAVKCGDSAGASRFHEDRQRLLTADPALPSLGDDFAAVKVARSPKPAHSSPDRFTMYQTVLPDTFTPSPVPGSSSKTTTSLLTRENLSRHNGFSSSRNYRRQESATSRRSAVWSSHVPTPNTAMNLIISPRSDIRSMRTKYEMATLVAPTHKTPEFARDMRTSPTHLGLLIHRVMKRWMGYQPRKDFS